MDVYLCPDGLGGEGLAVPEEDAALRGGTTDERDPALHRLLGGPLHRSYLLDLVWCLDRPHRPDRSGTIEDDRVERLELPGEGEREGRGNENGAGGEVCDHMGGCAPA